MLFLKSVFPAFVATLVVSLIAALVADFFGGPNTVMPGNIIFMMSAVAVGAVSVTLFPLLFLLMRLLSERNNYAMTVIAQLVYGSIIVFVVPGFLLSRWGSDTDGWLFSGFLTLAWLIYAPLMLMVEEKTAV